jgi:oxaloacetate decarboxylase gamma subunit
MTILQMFEQSAILTVLGMAVVFVFLWVMILCISLVGKLVHSRGWDQDVQAQSPGREVEGTVQSVPPEIIAAIMTGINEYRKIERT